MAERLLSKIPFRLRLIVGLLIVLLCALAAWGFILEPRRLVVHATTIALPELPQGSGQWRIAAISDLHVGSDFMTLDRLREITARVNALQPDLIVLLGDYVRNNHSDKTVSVAPEDLARPLSELRARHGVYAVLGNHDWWFDGERVSRAFTQSGIRMLDNDAVRITDNDRSIWLAGIGDHWTRHHNINGALEKITDESPVIAITHSPDIFPELPGSVALLLAGHTHGGQVSLPLLGRLVVPSRYGARYAAGHVREDGRDLFVTTGVGTSILPVRFGVPPEIALLQIVPAD